MKRNAILLALLLSVTGLAGVAQGQFPLLGDGFTGTIRPQDNGAGAGPAILVELNEAGEFVFDIAAHQNDGGWAPYEGEATLELWVADDAPVLPTLRQYSHPPFQMSQGAATVVIDKDDLPPQVFAQDSASPPLNLKVRAAGGGTFNNFEPAAAFFEASPPDYDVSDELDSTGHTPIVLVAGVPGPDNFIDPDPGFVSRIQLNHSVPDPSTFDGTGAGGAAAATTVFAEPNTDNQFVFYIDGREKWKGDWQHPNGSARLVISLPNEATIVSASYETTFDWADSGPTEVRVDAGDVFDGISHSDNLELPDAIDLVGVKALGPLELRVVDQERNSPYFIPKEMEFDDAKETDGDFDDAAALQATPTNEIVNENVMGGAWTPVVLNFVPIFGDPIPVGHIQPDHVINEDLPAILVGEEDDNVSFLVEAKAPSGGSWELVDAEAKLIMHAMQNSNPNANQRVEKEVTLSSEGAVRVNVSVPEMRDKDIDIKAGLSEPVRVHLMWSGAETTHRSDYNILKEEMYDENPAIASRLQILPATPIIVQTALDVNASVDAGFRTVFRFDPPLAQGNTSTQVQDVVESIPACDPELTRLDDDDIPGGLPAPVTIQDIEDQLPGGVGLPDLSDDHQFVCKLIHDNVASINLFRALDHFSFEAHAEDEPNMTVTVHAYDLVGDPTAINGTPSLVFTPVNDPASYDLEAVPPGTEFLRVSGTVSEGPGGTANVATFDVKKADLGIDRQRGFTMHVEDGEGSRSFFSNATNDLNETLAPVKNAAVPTPVFTDVEPPVVEFDVSGLDPETGGALQFAANITDDVEVAGAYLEYYFETPDGDLANDTVILADADGDQWSGSVEIHASAKTMHLQLHAWDLAQNLVQTGVESVAVTDVLPPVLGDPAILFRDNVGPTEDGFVADDFTIIADVEDNIGVESVEFYEMDGAAEAWRRTASLQNGEWIANIQLDADNIAAGQHTIFVDTKDAELNTNSSSESLVVDDQAPATTATPVPGYNFGDWYTGTADWGVTLDASDHPTSVANSGVDALFVCFQEGSCSGQDFGREGDPASFSTGEDGDYDLSFYAADRAGNKETVQTESVRIDRVAPELAHQLSGDHVYAGDEWFTGPVTVELDPTDATSGIASTQYRLHSGDPFSSYSGPFVLTSDDASHTVEYMATDEAGHSSSTSVSFGIDTVKPAIEDLTDNDFAEPGEWFQIAAEVTDATSQVQSVKAVYGTNPTGTISNTVVLSAIADQDDVYGAAIQLPLDATVLRYTLTALDHAGNPTSTSVVQVNVGDRSPPEVSSFTVQGADDEGGYIIGRTTFQAHVADDQEVVRVIFEMDGENVAEVTQVSSGTDVDGTWQAEVPFSGLSDGEHTFTARAVDIGGNEGTAELVASVDNRPPELRDSAPNGWAPDATLQIIAEDMGSKVKSLSYKVWEDGTSEPAGFTHLIEEGQTVTAEVATSGGGIWHAKYRAEDILGHISNVQENTFRFDTEPPTTGDLAVWVGDEAADTYLVGDFTLRLPGVADNVGIDEVVFTADGEELGTGTLQGGVYELQVDGDALEDGSYVFGATVYDLARHAVSPQSIQRTVDNHAPVTTDDAPEDWVQSLSSVRLSVQEEGSGVAKTEYKVWKRGDDEPASFSQGSTISVPGDGQWRIRYRSIDKADNVEDAVLSLVRVDGEDPELGIVSDEMVVAGATYTIDVIADDDVSGIAHKGVWATYRFGGGEEQSVRLRSHADGHHRAHLDTEGERGPLVFTANATDKAGNVVDSAEFLVLLNDGEPPAITGFTVEDAEDDGFLTGRVTLSATAQDNTDVEGIDFFVGDQLLGTGLPTGSAWRITVDSTQLGDGLHNFVARARDAGGIAGESSTSAWVDNLPPTTSANLPDGHATAGQASLELSAVDIGSAVSRIEYRQACNGEPMPDTFQTYTGPIALQSGTCDFGYRAVDVVGHVEQEHSLQAHIDTVAPTVEFVRDLPRVVATGESLQVQVTAIDGASGVDSVGLLVDGVRTNMQRSGDTYSARFDVDAPPGSTLRLAVVAADEVANRFRTFDHQVQVTSVEERVRAVQADISSSLQLQSVQDNGDGTVDVTMAFEPPLGARGVQVWRSNSPYVLVADLDGNTTNFTDSGAPEGSKYRVTAYLVVGGEEAGRVQASPEENLDGFGDLGYTEAVADPVRQLEGLDALDLAALGLDDYDAASEPVQPVVLYNGGQSARTYTIRLDVMGEDGEILRQRWQNLTIPAHQAVAVRFQDESLEGAASYAMVEETEEGDRILTQSEVVSSVGSPWIVVGWILLGLGVLALIGAGVWLALRNRQERPRSGPDEADEAIVVADLEDVA